MEPLRKATKFEASDKLIRKTADGLKLTLDEARKIVDEGIARENVWINDRYQVTTTTYEDPNMGPIMQINIRRRDGKVIFRDWRDFQEIKNQLAGAECEGVEVYPAESRKVDRANKYHLWVCLDSDMRVPFGWQERDVSNAISDMPGHRQRPLSKSDRNKQ